MSDANDRVEKLVGKIDSEIKKKKNTLLTTVIGGAIILIIIIVYYNAYVMRHVPNMVKPEELMQMGRFKVQEVLPQVSKEMEADLKKRAPEVARYSRRQIMSGIPESRKYLEKQFIAETEKAIDDLVTEFDKMVTQSVSENREVVVGFMKDIQNDEKKKQVEEQIFQSLKMHFEEPQIKADLDAYTKVLKRLNKKINYMYETKELTEEEKIVLDIIYAMRELAKRGDRISVQ